MRKTQNTIKKKTLFARSATTISNISQLYYSSSKEAIQFRHIWNHIIVMLQHPLSACVYEKTEDDYKFKFRINSDPLSEPRFKSLLGEFDKLPVKLADNISTSSNDRSPKWKEGFLFQIFNSQYFLLLISVYNNTPKSSSNRKLRLIGNLDWMSELIERKQKTDFQLDNIARQVEHFLSINTTDFTRELKTEPLQNYIINSIKASIKTYQAQRQEKFKSKCPQEDTIRLTELQKHNKYLDIFTNNQREVNNFARGIFEIDEFKGVALLKDRRKNANLNTLKSVGGADSGYLSRIYRKMSGGLLSLKETSGASLINMYLFIADCSPSNSLPRCPTTNGGKGVYNYNSRACFSSEQRLEIASFFKEKLVNRNNFLTQYKDSTERRTRKILPATYSSLKATIQIDDKDKDLICEALDFADNWFWEAIELNKIDEILDVLESPFGCKLRSVIDATYWNKSVHFSNVFFGGGIKRCFGGGVNTKLPSHFSEVSSDVVNDIRRLCATYYYFRGMMSDDDRLKLDQDESRLQVNQIGLMLVPIEVQSCVFVVSANLVALKPEVDGNEWQRNVDIFNAVSQKLKRITRRTYKEIYFDVVESIFFRNYLEFLSFLNNSNSNEVTSDFSTLEMILNKDLNTLETIMPFKTIELRLALEDSKFIDPSTEPKSITSILTGFLATKEGKAALKWLTRRGSNKLDLTNMRDCVDYFNPHMFDATPFLPGDKVRPSAKILVTFKDNQYFPTESKTSNRLYLRPEEIAFHFMQKTQQTVYMSAT
jgi:hypothetical protein